jgi:hypothetical protein
MLKFTLEVFSQKEIQQFQEEMKRIKDKYTTGHEPCEFSIEEGEVDAAGGRLIYLLANQAMMEAFIIEQIT